MRRRPLFGRFGQSSVPSWPPVVRECVDYVPVIEGAEGRYGAGLLCSEHGLMLTNAHVAAHDSLTVVLKDGTRVNGLPLYEHTTLDLAIVQMQTRPPSYFKLGERIATRYEAGDEVLAIGHPHGLTHTVTRGIISQDRRFMDDQVFVQTDVAINPGNSGGPLLDPKGRLVGINTQTIRDSQGLGLAIPADEVWGFWTDFLSHADAKGRRIDADQGVANRIRARTPHELVRAAASVAEVEVVKRDETRDGRYWATTRSGHRYGVLTDERHFLLTCYMGVYRRNNPGLLLRLLRLQGDFDFVRFAVRKDNEVYLWCSRSFEDLDLSEAALSLREMEQAIDQCGDFVRHHLDD